jgi:hypothetical protein
VLDELQIHQIPVLFGAGRRLFEVLPSRVELQIVRVIDTPEPLTSATASGARRKVHDKQSRRPAVAHRPRHLRPCRDMCAPKQLYSEGK